LEGWSNEKQKKENRKKMKEILLSEGVSKKATL
jgi:hypothetical protein